MKHKDGYFLLTVAWIGGALVGAGMGYLAIRSFRGDPKSGYESVFNNLALFFIFIIVVGLAALVMGFICTVIALLVGGYNYVLRTIFIMLPMIIAVVFLTVALWLLVFLLPFVPAFARYITLRTAPKALHSISPSTTPPTK